ncbi:hypothetical protein [Robertmurraya massiliosenegalensis]|uniref:hypothetical protein n=1 Tax=Robertmurraya massiliosenegalensis TaxID=1287657 RepID=UPI000368E891|nr:hypothetical protein [Robertmurraya massiliosenegalensis]
MEKIKSSNNNLSYLGRKLQGYFNAKKSEFLQALKQRGTFMECCDTCGFIYALTISAFSEQITLTIGLKNGEITIHEMVRQNVQSKAS